MTTNTTTSEEKPKLEVNSAAWWCKRVNDAKVKYKDDFDRMRANMEFVAGYQWLNQEKLDSDKYIANLTLRLVNQKKATLYAKNPTAEATRRERMDYLVWDGTIESLMSAMQSFMMNPMDVHAAAVLNDYLMGRQKKEVVDKICQTLKLVYNWNVDEQQPSFKTQMKDLVGRVLVCGVGYVKLNFVRDARTPLTEDSDNSTMVDRNQRAKALLEKISTGDIEADDAQVEQLRLLLTGSQMPSAWEDPQDVTERLVFDFIPATSVIVDPLCRTLRGFTGARWIAQEYMLPLNEVNEYFECQVNASSELKTYNLEGEEAKLGDKADGNPNVCVWEIFDKRTLTHCYVCEGYDGYLQEPEPISPLTKHVWPVFPLTFNSVEVEPGCKVTIFPPSDVDLVKPAQREWNRTRQAQREQRRAKEPKYMTSAELSDDDKDRLLKAAPHSVVKLNSVPSGSDLTKIFQPIPTLPVDPQMVDTNPYQVDILQTSGQQEANLGNAPADLTATVGTIAEQSRVTASSSNVDDLDDFLTLLAQSGGEMLIRELSNSTALAVAGPGAVWPEESRMEFLNDIQLKIAAASSGRPNQALDVSRFQTIAPLLMQAGANPKALIEEGVKRLGDNIDLTKFFPNPMAMMSQQPMQPAQQLPPGQQANIPENNMAQSMSLPGQ